MNFIEKLQNKPRFLRVQILWISVVLVMIVIFFAWTVYLKSILTESNNKQTKEEGQSLPSIFGIISKDFSLLKQSVQAQFNGILKNNEEQKFEIEITTPQKLPE